MVYLTFTYEFNATHRLWSNALSEQENEAIYGVCANDAGHGHRFRLEVTVRREVTPEHPVVLSRDVVRRLTDEVLAPRLAHANLNQVFGGDDFIATGENVTREIWRLLEPEVAGEAALHSVRLVETSKNSFVYYGENGSASEHR